MEAFSALLALCAENSPVPGPGEFPAQRPMTQSFDLRLNKCLSKKSWGWWFETLLRPLWRHYNVTSKSNSAWLDFTVMQTHLFLQILCQWLVIINYNNNNRYQWRKIPQPACLTSLCREDYIGAALEFHSKKMYVLSSTSISFRPFDAQMLNYTYCGSDNGLSPGRYPSIIWRDTGLLLSANMVANFTKIWIIIHTTIFIH